jgi:serine/threonine protein kinase/putative intracellular protease/amidase
LGIGGMGAAYLAEHRRMQRPVVLKVVRRELLSNAAVAERFQIEVRAAARLSHPNIVQAHDADQAGDLHFLVMEYVEGRTLAQVVARHGPLSVVHACHYARQAAAGLQHAHEKGMVHRDVKPQNLMLTPAGQVKILDFGLAQFAREWNDAPQTDAAAATAALRGSATIVTAAGAVFGTPDYIAPEQAVSSRDVDTRADVYSLGCTLFYLLQGRPPFEGGTIRDKLAAHRGRPLPRLVDGREPLPAELVRVVERMTAKSPADRYATPGEVAKALAPFTKSSSAKTESAKTPAPAVIVGRVTPAPVKKRPSRVVLASTASVVVIGAALAAAWSLRDKPTGSPPDPNAPAAKAVPPSPAVMRPPTVLMILPQQFQTADYVEARRVLETDAGLRVRVASTGPCRPMEGPNRGPNVTPDLTLPNDAPRAADYDALYFAGGNIFAFKDAGPVRELVWRLVDEFVAAGKPVAAIGTGQGILAFRGTLAGRTVSKSPMVAQFLPDYAATLSNDPVVADGALLTAGDSQAAPLLAKKLALVLRPKAKVSVP